MSTYLCSDYFARDTAYVIAQQFTKIAEQGDDASVPAALAHLAEALDLIPQLVVNCYAPSLNEHLFEIRDQVRQTSLDMLRGAV